MSAPLTLNADQLNRLSYALKALTASATEDRVHFGGDLCIEIDGVSLRVRLCDGEYIIDDRIGS